MSEAVNTLLLRLEGPMQSWGTGSRFQIRRTGDAPSKSGVLGLILCAMGVPREESEPVLARLSALRMGVRIDRPGTLGWDYHTAGAGIGIRQAKGGIKFTASTGEPETLLSRRQYLYDASFLVALHGAPELVAECAAALENPVWPVFLGRKCCVPSAPVLAGVRDFPSVEEALAAEPWRPRHWKFDQTAQPLRTIVEHSPGTPPPARAEIVYDNPERFGFNSQTARLVIRGTVSAPEQRQRFPSFRPKPKRRRPNYQSKQWREIRQARLEHDTGRCVFCAADAVEVHHATYERVGREELEDLRSLCKVCHDACTILEYSRGMEMDRIDPLDQATGKLLREQIDLMAKEANKERHRRLLREFREYEPDFVNPRSLLDKEAR